MRKTIWAGLALGFGFALSGCNDGGNPPAGSISIPPSEKAGDAAADPNTPEVPESLGRKGGVD